MLNTKLIKNIASKSFPFMKKIACIDGGGFLVSVLGAKMAQKLKKKNGQNFQLKHRKAQKSIWDLVTHLFRRVGDQCHIQENWHNTWPWLLWVTFALFCQPCYKLLLTFAHLIMLHTWIFKVQKSNWTDNVTVFLRTQLCPLKQDHTQKSNSPSSIFDQN